MGSKPKQVFLKIRLTNGHQLHEKILRVTNDQGNQYQNHVQCRLTPVRMAISKMAKDNKNG